MSELRDRGIATLLSGHTVEFECGHHRVGEIQIVESSEVMKCNVCRETVDRVLWSDSSEGEYGGCAICFGCLAALVSASHQSEGQ